MLGELYPLRAFGDVRYKWTMELLRVVLEPLGIQPPQQLLTSPYLTSKPEVFYRRLTPNDKFLVLASDGLWECELHLISMSIIIIELVQHAMHFMEC